MYPTREIAKRSHSVLSYLRDRALILVLYFGGMTRTEIATLYRENIIEYPGEDKTLLPKVNTSG